MNIAKKSYLLLIFLITLLISIGASFAEDVFDAARESFEPGAGGLQFGYAMKFVGDLIGFEGLNFLLTFCGIFSIVYFLFSMVGKTTYSDSSAFKKLSAPISIILGLAGAGFVFFQKIDVLTLVGAYSLIISVVFLILMAVLFVLVLTNNYKSKCTKLIILGVVLFVTGIMIELLLNYIWSSLASDILVLVGIVMLILGIVCFVKSKKRGSDDEPDEPGFWKSDEDGYKDDLELSDYEPSQNKSGSAPAPAPERLREIPQAAQPRSEPESSPEPSPAPELEPVRKAKSGGGKIRTCTRATDKLKKILKSLTKDEAICDQKIRHAFVEESSIRKAKNNLNKLKVDSYLKDIEDYFKLISAIRKETLFKDVDSRQGGIDATYAKEFKESINLPEQALSESSISSAFNDFNNSILRFRAEFSTKRFLFLKYYSYNTKSYNDFKNFLESVSESIKTTKNALDKRGISKLEKSKKEDISKNSIEVLRSNYTFGIELIENMIRNTKNMCDLQIALFNIINKYFSDKPILFGKAGIVIQKRDAIKDLIKKKSVK